MKKRIVIVGGAGFLGSRAVAALRTRDDVEVVVAGRSGPDLTLDLGRPASFAALAGAAVVVNVSSSHAAAPDALAEHCVRHGLVMLEASSDRVVVERLLGWRGGGPMGPGTVVLGAGIYTGLSNLLGAAAMAAQPGATSLEIGIRSSPFSGAGQGTVDLMVDAMAVPARVVRDGTPTTTPAALPGPVLPFALGARRTLTFSFPEVSMLTASTGARDVSLGFAPAPAVLWPSFRYLPTWLLTSSVFRWGMGRYFEFLRRFLLKNVASRVELVARSRGPAGQTVCALVADDGFATGGAALAAMALQLAQHPPGRRGVVTVDEVMALDEAVALTRALAPAATLRVERGGAAR
jgi:hypothetical protein